jgi:predicted AlkP superfamily pyrophosphatase or phosphodiesterase
VVSVDGMRPDVFQRPEALGLRVPTLRRLAAEGVQARVQGVLPSVTYPSHTTLATGVPPRLHGIDGNRVFDPEGQRAGGWHWYAEDIRVPTLLSAARVRGLATAEISWPVLMGGGADSDLPEFWRPGANHPDELKLQRAIATPGLVAAVERAQGHPMAWPPTDSDRMEAALHVLRTRRPALLMLHLFDGDTAEHDLGPDSPEARAAFEATDALLARLLTALDETGLSSTTLLAVVSDHGFLPISRQVSPNVWLREAGLIDVADGKVTGWRAFFQVTNGSAGLRLHDPQDAASLARVQSLLREKAADPGNGLHEVMAAERIAALGGPAEWALALDAESGYSFTDGVGDVAVAPSTQKGQHGHAPDRPELNASLILRAPGLQPRDLGLVPMTRIAPTVARYLGLTLSPEAGPALDVLPAR